MVFKIYFIKIIDCAENIHSEDIMFLSIAQKHDRQKFGRTCLQSISALQRKRV